MGATKEAFMQLQQEQTAGKTAVAVGKHKRQNIFQITEDLLHLQEALEDSGGEITEELEQHFNQIQQNLQEKAAGYGYVILAMDADVETLEGEIRRLTAMKTRKQNSCKRLRDAIRSCMEVAKIKKLQTPTVTLSLRSSKSVQITDENLIPEEYKVPKPSEISKTLIRAALDEGTAVLGATLEEKNSLQVK